jgi:hypothetical protein
MQKACVHVHGLLPSFLHASQQCLLILIKPLVVLVIVKVPLRVLLGELSLSTGLGI